MIPHNEMCTMCLWAHHDHTGEWQCWQCQHWYYTWQTPEGDRKTVRVYDRDATDEQWTAQAQAVITHACQFLALRGRRKIANVRLGNWWKRV